MRVMQEIRWQRLAAGLCLVAIVAGAGAGAIAGCEEPVDTGTSTSHVQTTDTPVTGGSDLPVAEGPSASTESEHGQTYSSSEDDHSAIAVTDGTSLSITDARVESSGDSSNVEAGRSDGLNAAVAATGGSVIMSGDYITTTGRGAGAAFAAGEESLISLAGVTIETTGRDSYGVVATRGGAATLDDVKITTAADGAVPIAADAGGTVAVTGGQGVSSGRSSPALFSAGALTANTGAYEASGSEGAIIEGTGTLTLTDVSLSTKMRNGCGVAFRRAQHDAGQGTRGSFTMTGGSLSATGSDSPLFCVTDSLGLITLENVDLKFSSGVLMSATAGAWGGSHLSGGRAALVATGQMLRGDIVADAPSTLSVRLNGHSVLAGAINSDNAAKRVDLSIDATSAFVVTANTYLTSVTIAGGVSGTAIACIIGNGHTVFYVADDAANSALGGRTFTLSGGGVLRPLD